MTMTDDKFRSRLDRWLWTNRMDGAEFARKVGVSKSLVSRWRNRLRTPVKSDREKIAKLTKGAVSLDDWED